MTVLRVGDPVGNYRIEGLLGRGGQGIVYEAVHLVLGTQHAIKVLVEESISTRSRLLDEGRIQARLRHPHLVPVTDVVEVEGALGLVAERVRGMALDAWVMTQEPDHAARMRVFRQICEGLAVAHAAGVIHRDLKPENILVELREDGPFARVTDFGIAKAPPGEGAPRPATLAGAPLGTLGYMAPEQIDDAGRVDARADVFALGCILYELLSGERPFPDARMHGYGASVRTGRPVSLVDLPIGAAPATSAVVDACLAADPAGRPADAAALLGRLDASPVPPRSRRGWRGPLGVGIVILLLGTGVTAGSLWSSAPDAPPSDAPPSDVPPSDAGSATAPVTAVVTSVAPASPEDAAASGSAPIAVRPAAPRPAPPGPRGVSPAPEPPAGEAGGAVSTDLTVFGRVIATGDGRLESLTRDGVRAAPTHVPPGVWHMEVQFDAASAVDAGMVSVHAGDTIRVQCVAEFLQCRVIAAQ